MKDNKKTECPQCLGIGYIYDPESESDIVCPLCNREGEVSVDTADDFDPLSFTEIGMKNENFE